MLEKLRSPKITNIGSSLKFSLVAEGRADLYFRDLPTMEWDTAAAQCVVEAAGGLVLEPSGEPLRYGKPGLRNSGFVAFGDPALHWRAVIAD
jgi:3'(2'), 5'-bisphosphate nucleotidase